MLLGCCNSCNAEALLKNFDSNITCFVAAKLVVLAMLQRMRACAHVHWASEHVQLILCVHVLALS